MVFFNRFGFLGSIDSNTGSPDLGWDTDQFPMDIKNCTLVMKVDTFDSKQKPRLNTAALLVLRGVTMPYYTANNAYKLKNTTL